MTAEIVISCDGLYSGYGDVAVVRDLTLNVHQGEVVVLLGPNGAGKTTTLLTIAGLLPKLSGEVLFCDQPVSWDRPHLMAGRGLAFVPDNRSLVSGLSVRDNLRIAVRKGGLKSEDVLDMFPPLRSRRLFELVSCPEESNKCSQLDVDSCFNLVHSSSTR